MPIKKLRPEFAFTEDRLKELQQVVPEAFADGKINWDTLREALGEHIEDEAQEHFGLTWPGKREARRLAAMPSKGTLIPQPGEGVNEENASNIFIEGENLEVLKLLQKSYAGRVKMIYIDPPYNTGNDFIYSDDFAEPLEAYLRHTGQKDEEGQLLTTNTRANGRFHSNWLNMMFPRLFLARQLLREDGAIFISIDDNEVSNLHVMMNEIFGEENFLVLAPTIMNLKGNQDEFGFAGTHEYTIVYAKSKLHLTIGQFDVDEEMVESEWEQDEIGYYKKGANLKRTGIDAPREKRPKGFYPVFIDPINLSLSLSRRSPEDVELFPITQNQEMSWRWSQEKLQKSLNEVIVVQNDDNFSLYKKQRPELGDLPSKKPKTVFYKPEYSSGNGTNEFNNLFGVNWGASLRPKPLILLKDFVKIGTSANDIVLDFFAGSATLAHAVLKNNQDGNARRFICIQYPEEINKNDEAYKAGYKTISEIAKERIRRAVAELQEENAPEQQDLGFVCFRLKPTHYKDWQLVTELTPSQLEMQFNSNESSLIDGWEPQTLLTEILLLQGFPLDSRVEYQEDLLQNQVYRVSCEWHEHGLFVCLDEKVNELTVANLKLGSEDIFICLDTALSDESKMRLADQMNLHVI